MIRFAEDSVPKCASRELLYALIAIIDVYKDVAPGKTPLITPLFQGDHFEALYNRKRDCLQLCTRTLTSREEEAIFNKLSCRLVPEFYGVERAESGTSRECIVIDFDHQRASVWGRNSDD